MNQPTSLSRQSLPVMEHFYTIQGEGFHQGRAAYFVRLGGCDVGCVWCDVKDSWDANAHPKMSVSEIAATIFENTSFSSLCSLKVSPGSGHWKSERT